MTHSIYKLPRRLEDDHVHYTLSRHRDDSIMITATFVGERIEIDVFEDGHMEISRFLGREDVLGDETLVYDILDKKKFENKVWEGFNKDAESGKRE